MGKNIPEIQRLQDNLSVIRRVAGWTTGELGDLLGVAKQTISNLENGNTQMTKIQYIALRTVIDYEIYTNPEKKGLAQVVNVLLDTEEPDETDDMSIVKKENKNSDCKSKQCRNTSVVKTAGTVAAATVGRMMADPNITRMMADWMPALMKKKIH